MSRTKQDYDNARNLLGTDKLFDLANKLFHEKEDALKYHYWTWTLCVWDAYVKDVL